MIRLVFTPLLVLALASVARAQNTPSRQSDDRWSADLGIKGVGMSIGESLRWNGLRINWSDGALERVNGVNLTLWAPERDANSNDVINGAALGVVGPYAGTINGLAFRLGGVSSDASPRDPSVGNAA